MPPQHVSPVQDPPASAAAAAAAAASASSSANPGSTVAGDLAMPQLNRCVVKIEAPDLEVDELVGGKVLLGLCSMEAMLRFLCTRVAYSKDVSQIAHFVLAYEYVTTADAIIEAMNNMYFDESAKPDDLSRVRIGILAVLRTWVELNYASVRNNAQWLEAAMSFIDAADPQLIGAQCATWALLRALYDQSVDAQIARELADAMKSAESGIHLRAHGFRSHFSGQDFFDWTQDVAGVGHGDAEAIGEQLEDAGLIKSSFRTHSFSPAARYYFPSPEIALQPRGKEVAEALPLLEVAPVDLAEQLCLRESMLFKAIRLEELHRSVWTKPSKEEAAPNVLAMIRFSNKVSYWIATEILSNPNAKKRIEVLRRAITMASTCLQLGCYSAVAEIIGGLQHSAVRKLRATWMSLPFRYREMLHEVLSAMSPDDNSKVYREALRVRASTLTGASSEIPNLTGVVPHLGQYLTDITFIDTANQDSIRGLINFRKLRMIGAVLHDIRIFQRSSYSLRFRDEIQRVLSQSTLCPASDDELAAMSKFIETADSQAAAGAPIPPEKLQDILDTAPPPASQASKPK